MLKPIIISFLLSVLSMPVIAQQLKLATKAPELKVQKWANKTMYNKSAYLLEFYSSASTPSKENISKINRLASKYKDEFFVVVITKNEQDFVALNSKLNENVLLALDDKGKTFAAYGVRYLPFGALIGLKGRILWYGNSSLVDEKQLLDKLSN